MAGLSNILTDNHHTQIMQSLQTLAEMEREITLAKQAKIDVSKQEQALHDAREKLNLLKNVYFPNGI